LNHVEDVFSVTGQVIFYGVHFPSRKEGICSRCVRNVGTSSTVFATMEEPEGSWGLAELEEILAVASKS